MSYDKDEMGYSLRRETAERRRINYIPFDRDGGILGGMDIDGTYPAKYSNCPCSNRCAIHPKKKDTIFCMGCGNEVSTAITINEQAVPKSKKGRTGGKSTKTFIATQQPKKVEKSDFIKNLEAMGVTSYEETEYE